MLESAVQSKIIKQLEKLGCIVIKIIRANKSGIPDLLVLLPNGRAVFIEVKKPGGVASKLQQYYIELFRKQGFTAFICDDPQDAISTVERLMTPKTPQ